MNVQGRRLMIVFLVPLAFGLLPPPLPNCFSTLVRQFSP
jgi:hypothetical protein